jgi:hypothetical protein
MSAPNDNGTNNPQTVTGGQFGVIIDGSTINQNGVPAGTQILGPVSADGNITVAGTITATTFTGNITGNITNAAFATTAGVADTVSNAAQPNITSVGNLIDLSVVGNVTADYFIGNGSLLTGIVANTAQANYANFAGEAFSVDAANIVGNVQYANVAFEVDGANVNGAVAEATVAFGVSGSNVNGEVAFAAVANSVAGSNVSGEVSYAAVANSVDGGNVVGFVSDANFATAANTVILSDQPNITSVGNLTQLSVTGNVDVGGYVAANYYTGNGALLTGIVTGNTTEIVNGNSNVTIATAAGNIEMAVNGNPQVVIVTDSGVIVDGNLTASAFIGDGSQLTNLSVETANIANIAYSVDAANVNGTVASANTANIANIAYSVDAANVVGNVAVANLALSVDASNVVGNVAIANLALSVDGANVSGAVANATNANVAEFVSNAAQSNITSLGTLTSLSVSGAADVGSLSATGNVIADYYFGNASQLSGVIGNAANANFANVADTVSNAVQSNITAVGTLSSLSVSGDANVGSLSTVGNVTGAYIIGNGSLLTDIVATSANYANFSGNAFSVDGANVVGDVSGANIANIAYSVDAANVVGNVAYANEAFSVDGANVFGEVAFAAQANSVGTLANISVTGNIGNADYITANFFVGDGSLLSNISLTGNVANANYANFAGTAFSVDAANIVGNVAIANLALSVSGSNVSGEVAFAAVANSVAGSNVSGEVALAALANIANVAYSVDAANVVGNVAVANTALSVDGANVSGEVALAALANIANIAYSVDAANIVGNVAFANVADTVSNAAQPNITSVGTLADLSVTGNVTADYFVGNGSLLTGISSGVQSSIANGDSNVSIATANGAVSMNVPNATDPTQTNLFTLGTNGALTFENPVSTQASIFNGSSFRTNARGGGWTFNRGRGTKAAPLSLQPNDEVGQIFFSPHNGTTVGNDGATIRAIVDPSYVANQSVVPVNWRIGSAANVGNVNTYNFSWFYANTQFTPAGNIVTIANSDHNLGNSVTANYFVGNGSLLTGIASGVQSSIANGTSNVTIATANADVTVSVNGTSNVVVLGNTTATIAANLLPAANVIYDLGSNTSRWNDIWLANSTIHLGDQTISANTDGVNISGNFALTEGAALEFGVDTKIYGANVSVNEVETPAIVIGNINAATDAANFFINYTPNALFITNDSVIATKLTFGSLESFTGPVSYPAIVIGPNLDAMVASTEFGTIQNFYADTEFGVLIGHGTLGDQGGIAIGQALAYGATAWGVAIGQQAAAVGGLAIQTGGPEGAEVQAGPESIAIGQRHATNYTGKTITIGNDIAGIQYSDSISIGNDINNAGDGIIIGSGTVDLVAEPGEYSIGIGRNVYTTRHSIAMGTNANAQYESIAIGKDSYSVNEDDPFTAGTSIAIGVEAKVSGVDSIAIGRSANVSANNTIVLNATGSELATTTDDAFYVSPVRGAVTGNVMYYDGGTGEVTYGVPTLPNFTVAQAANVTGAIGQMVAISDATPGGRMAFWDTTNSRWSYVNDNSAV